MHNKLRQHVNNILKSNCTIGKYYKNRQLPKIKYFKHINSIDDYNCIIDNRRIKKSYLNKLLFFIFKKLNNNDLNKIQKIYHGFTYNNIIYISDKLNYQETESTIVHELAHCLEIENEHLKPICRNEHEYNLLDEVYACAAELEYYKPNRRITRSITSNIREEYVPDDYY